MADKISKIGKKLFETEKSIVKDIHELVVELKHTVLELENIATKLQEKAFKKLNDTEIVVHKKPNDRVKDSEIQDRIHHQLVNCDVCSKRFKNKSDLEKHIKMKHEEYPTYKCDICSKQLITNWRLEKHTKMQLKNNLKLCRHYSNNKHCPFDELGCKFQH